MFFIYFFFFQAEDGIRDPLVTGVQTCALPILRMDTLVERVRACPKAEGFDEILLPGELEAREEEKRTRSGIPYSAAEIDPLQAEAARAGVAKLDVSSRPLDA